MFDLSVDLGFDDLELAEWLLSALAGLPSGREPFIRHSDVLCELTLCQLHHFFVPLSPSEDEFF